jgi:pyruvate/2-oxoglutarate dehydrogenase complex dihydrolipoamide acyltransferase (E2) component
MTRLRKRVATRLKDSQNTFALLTTFNEIDMYGLAFHLKCKQWWSVCDVVLQRFIVFATRMFIWL